MLQGLWKRALYYLREEGVISMLYRTVGFLKRFLVNGFTVHDYQTDVRIDTYNRWELIQDHLSSDDSNVLDIGCADGLLTSIFANNGMFCTGIDRNQKFLAIAQKRYRFENGIGFIQYEIDPSTIMKLPHYDVILLLTVYHWWCVDYGLERAEDMLRTLGEKSNKLFFEPPGVAINELELEGVDVSGAEVNRSDGQSIEDYYQSYLHHVFNGEAGITYLGETEYSEGNRKDPVFMISTADFLLDN